MIDIASLLIEGDRRTVRGVERVVVAVLKQPSVLSALFKMFSPDNESLNMRVADALQKIFIRQPSLLNPYKHQLIFVLETYPQKEVRWHMAQILPYLPLDATDSTAAAAIWKKDFSDSKSSIVKTCSLQALFDLAKKDEHYKQDLDMILAKALEDGSPAVRARAKRLLKNLS